MNPITRKETFLAKAGGQSVNTPKPITREEMFLQKIAENGGGTGGGVTSWNDLTDKPFDKTMEDTELASGEYTSVLLPDYGVYSVMADYSERLEEKPESATITLDGVEYKDLKITPIAGLGDMCGNLALLNGLLGTSYENTGEPFMASVGDAATVVFTSDTAPTNHSVKVVAPMPVIHPLSQEYIDVPTFDLREIGLPQIPTDGSVVSTNADASELEKAVRKGCVRLIGEMTTGTFDGFAYFVFSNLYYRCNIPVTNGIIEIEVGGGSTNEEITGRYVEFQI